MGIELQPSSYKPLISNRGRWSCMRDMTRHEARRCVDYMLRPVV